MVERQSNPFPLAMAVIGVGPKELENIRFTNFNVDGNGRFNRPNSTVWLKKPNLTEFALVKAYFGLVERNGHLDEGYVKNLFFILNWILETDRMSGKKLHLEEEEKKEIRTLKVLLKAKNALSNIDLIGGLNFFLTAYAMLLVEVGVLAGNNNFPDEGVPI